MLKNVEDEPDYLTKVITGDELCVYGYDPETKAQSSQWITAKHSPKPKEGRMECSRIKTMLIFFFLHARNCASQIRTHGHHGECSLLLLSRLKEDIRRKRPSKWASGWIFIETMRPATKRQLFKNSFRNTKLLS